MENPQDKTEQATPYKLEQSRKKGMVPRSVELLSFTVLASFLVVFLARIDSIAATIAGQTYWWFHHANDFTDNLTSFIEPGKMVLRRITYSVAPLFFGVALLVIIVSLMYSGFVFSLFPLKLDLKRLNPIAGLKKIFSKKMLVELVKVVLKGLLYFVVLYFAISHLLNQLMTQMPDNSQTLIHVFKDFFIFVALCLIAVMGFFAVFDIWYAKRDFARQMRMSTKDIKDEYRNREGGPEVKNRRRRIQQELLNKIKGMAQVKNADVIITNPTHYAVALQYLPEKMAVPIVLATGKGMLAKMILRLARMHRVPIVRQPPLARAIYTKGRLNDPIPVDVHSDVVTVYRWVISLPNSKLKL